MKHRAIQTFCFLLLSFYALAQPPNPDFTSNITAGCSPIVVNFQNLTSGDTTNVKWLWDLGDRSSSTLANPSAIYSQPGTYTITLIATNSTGSDTITKTGYITVYDQPTANFTVDKRIGCFPAVMLFSDQSTTPPGTTVTAWSWDFGDGTTSTEQNPRHVYPRQGIYTVTLQITNSTGCSKVITQPNYIEVTRGVVPRFTFSDPSVCSAPATVTFQTTSTGPPDLSYAWDFGNGVTSAAPSASVVFQTNGTYRVKLLVSSSQGCSDSASATLDIGKVVTDITIPDKICPETLVPFINNSTPRPISAYWQFSNGKTDTLRNTTNSFAAGGTYSVTLINTYGVCIDTFTKEFTVLDAPTIDFTAANKVSCKPPLTPDFAINSNAVSYSWNFGDGSSATQTPHTYTGFGEFDVSLIATGSNGCMDTMVKPKFIRIQKPVISFPALPARGCVPLTLNLEAAVSTPDVVTSYKWDFGDGGTSTAEKPVHTYNTQGTFTVTLTITTSTGCTETLSMPNAVRLGTKPVASFTGFPRDVCASEPIQFISTSPQPVDEWLWLFGDGGRSFSENPRHKFSDTGLMFVKLVAFNNGCPSDTAVELDYVHIKPPVSSFRYSPNCDNRLEIAFRDRSIGPLTWNWNFGDGTTSTMSNPVHLYSSFGTYTVTLITTNGDCADTARRNITIRDLTPDFNAAVREGCRPFTASLTAVAPDPGLVQSYIWDFGDGTQQNFGTSPVATHTYSNIGNYNIRLTTIDTFGCSHTLLKNNFIRVNGPKANFTSSSNTGCKGLVTTFTDASITDGINKIVRWKWDFGDGTVQTFTQGPFTHRYDSIADYDVKLVVTDEKGCTDSISYLAFVKLSSITADWSTPGETCPGAAISFRNNSKSDFPYTSVWSFGDGQSLAITDPAASQNASHVYADTALYTVKLKVRDLFGCEDSLSKVNVVKVSLPVASFDANAFITYCIPFEAKFKNTSTFYTSSSWSFGAGQGTSTLRDPNNFFVQKGVYEVKLEVRSPGGCKDDTTQIITVNTPADGKINYTPLSGCKPALVSFDAFTKMNARFIWDFGDGNVVDTNTNVIQHVYRDFGTFIPRIILRELGTSCSFPVTGVQPINLLGVTTKYTIDKQFFCDSGLVTILDSTTYNDPIAEYKWDFGDGTTFNAPNPGGHTYKNPGIYNVSLIVNTQAGCTDTLIKGPIKVVESPLIAVETDTVICVNDTLRHLGIFQRTDTSVVKWLWQFPNGNSSTLQNPPVQKYPTAGSFFISTVATNSSGCADTVTKSLLVNPLPVITLVPTLTKFVGVPITLPATYSRNTVSYAWTPATSLSCTDCPQPVSETKFNRTYTVIVTDSNGCVNTDVVQVIVLCQGNKLFMPNTFSPNGDGSNDMFYPRGTGLDRVKSLRIFNRWGEVVFEQRDFPTNNAAFGWNGMYKGKKALPDVYIYQAEIFCENSEIIRFEGNIALIQ